MILDDNDNWALKKKYIVEKDDIEMSDDLI